MPIQRPQRHSVGGHTVAQVPARAHTSQQRELCNDAGNQVGSSIRKDQGQVTVIKLEV
eukprot:CAMPEP_0194546648 /NCGR_PEP_ID=MMETSP0253-20130528/90962_1 /TAXON_ID=2966 /ORGANISM="Noctiluca scintillans" /LENGTH=57 /DNA_ID=CAMNT_0039393767 /DNA_START=201 /DNA_END=374 /DNA_ORIENTATION=-